MRSFLTSAAVMLLVSSCGCSSKKAASGALPPTEPTTAPGTGSQAPAKASPKLATVNLETSDTPEDTTTGAGPKHKFRLVVTVNGEAPQTTELGEYQGACGSAPDAKELVKLKCWWAGAGDDLAIYKEGDDLVVTRTGHDEEVAEPQKAVEIARVKLPAGTEIKLAPMEGGNGN